MLETNLTGVFNGCRAAARHFLTVRRGKVINVASVTAVVGLSQYPSYAATKGGVVAFTRALAVEWARHNVQVNAIAPGWFLTDMNAHAFADGRLRERLLRDVPMRRTGRAEEIGPLAATSKTLVPISGVCAVFAESEVINCLSQGNAPADIMQGSIVSLVDRSVQLMKRVQLEPEVTLIGGILRFETMAKVVREKLGMNVNVSEGDMVQFVSALGAALLARHRLNKIRAGEVVAAEVEG